MIVTIQLDTTTMNPRPCVYACPFFHPEVSFLTKTAVHSSASEDSRQGKTWRFDFFIHNNGKTQKQAAVHETSNKGKMREVKIWKRK